MFLGICMIQLLSSLFFDLSTFAHSALFEKDPFPWQILAYIESYCKKQSLGQKQGIISPQAYLICPELIIIGKGTVIEPGAYLKGPCIIGEDCVIRHGAYIRGNVILGDRCVIGHDTEVKNSILLNDAHAAHFAYVGDSILGNHVNLGAGVKLANFKLNHSLISIRLENQKITTNKRKLGAIIGDQTQIGCNTVTSPGTLIGQRVQIYPCLHIEGFIPSHALVKPSIKPLITIR
jgi:NDP-sugar pyrophosphorylase family protein